MLDRATKREMDRMFRRMAKDFDRHYGGSATVSHILDLHESSFRTEEPNFGYMKEYITKLLGTDAWLYTEIDTKASDLSHYATAICECFTDMDKTGAASLAAILVYAYLQHGEGVAVMGAEGKISKDLWLREMIGVCEDYALGYTMTELAMRHKVVNNEWLQRLKSEGLADITFTKDMVRIHLTLFYDSRDQEELKAALGNPSYVFSTSLVVSALTYGKCVKLQNELYHERAKKERIQTQRKPTKKQSEVIADLKRELREKDATIAKERKQHDATLHEAAARADALLDKTRAELEELREQLAEYQEEEKLDQEIEDSGIELLPLPSKGITFIGGHQRLVARLRAKYPKWQFLEAGDSTSSISPLNVVFLFTQHLSHKNDERVAKQVERGNYYRVTCGNNVGLVLRQLQWYYTQHERRDSDEA